MPIEYVRGDLVAAADETVIAHGCNALGKFGSGFAGALNLAIPEARRAYLEGHARGMARLGAVIWARSRGRFIANCITQPTFGRSGLHLDYDALRACMRTLNATGRDGDASIGLPNGYRRIAMPLIGSDRGGGDWARISAVIEAEMVDVSPIVYHLPGADFTPPDPRLPGL